MSLNTSVEELTSLGFVVKLQHHRRWSYTAPKDHLFMAHETPSPHVALKLGRPESELDTVRTTFTEMQHTGGATTVELSHPVLYGEVVSHGLAACSNEDNYIRKVGRGKALKRALDDNGGTMWHALAQARKHPNPAELHLAKEAHQVV